MGERIQMKHWRLWLGVGAVAFMIVYAGDFYFTRWVHYKLSYQSQVEGTVRQMVKASCLQE